MLDEKNKKRTVWNKGKNGLQIAWNKGKKYSDKTRKKMSDSRKELYRLGKINVSGVNNGMYGKTPWNKGKKGVQKGWNKGKKVSLEVRLKNSGENNYKWKGGCGSVNMQIRKSYEYRQWVQDIFKRDDYSCVECGNRGGRLEAHHIKPFSILIKENNIKTKQQGIECSSIWDYDNGVTLCKDCHKKTDTYLKHNL